MSQSQEIKELAKALAAAQASLSAAKKDSINPHFRNQYASLQSIWDTAREVLAPNGFSVVQTFGPTDGTRLDLTTTLMHVSGQWVSGTISITPTKQDPQGIGSAATYARRYSLAAILGIVADEDDDGEQASKPRESASVKSPPREVPKSVPAASNKSGWRNFIVPKFIKKHAGKTLEDLPDNDILWWAANYTPKLYNGSIQPQDSAFRDALTEAEKEINTGAIWDKSNIGTTSIAAMGPAEDNIPF